MGSLALVLAVLLSVLYTALAFIAFGRVKQEKKASLSDRFLALTLWWPFYDDLYDESARKLCLYGKFLFPVTAAAYVVWAVLR